MLKSKFALFTLLFLFSKAALACELACMLGISLGLHVMAAAIAVSVPSTPDNPTAKPFIVNIAPKAPASSTVPAGWAAGVSQYDTPVPPLTASGTGGGQTLPDVTQQQAVDACNASTVYSCAADQTKTAYCYIYTNPNHVTSNNGCRLTAWPYTTMSTNTFDMAYGAGSGGTSSPTCPAGYTLSGSSCALTAPESVPLPADGQKIMQRVGNAIASPRDTNDALPSGTTQPDPYTVNYAYPDGGYVEVKNDAATGVTTITNSKYDAANNSTKTEVATFEAPTSTSATGVSLSSYSATTTTGTGSPSSSNGGALTGSSSGATGSDVASLGNSINAKLEALNKTDYARKGEAKTAADTTNSLLNGIDTVTGQTAPIIGSMDSLQASLENSVNTQLPSVGYSWLPSFMPGASPAACVPFPIDANPTMGLASGFVGHGEIDICDKLYFVRELLGFFIGIFTMFYIFRTFTRSNKGS